LLIPLSTQHLVSSSPRPNLPPQTLSECQTSDGCYSYFSSAPALRLEAFVCNCPFLYSSSRASREGCLGTSEIKPRAEEDSTPIPSIDAREELNNWLNSNLLALESSKNSDCSSEESNQVHLAFRRVESLLLCQS